jgi:hypothetical protein
VPPSAIVPAEYKRHGVQCLNAAFSACSGKYGVSVTCMHPTDGRKASSGKPPGRCKAW